jgi:LuxR family transcriptional regulator, maltose regulon positive regulatory protein
VTDPKIHECVAFFLKHAPSHCHVVITTRTEPALPLASLRAQSRLLELDAAALRFDVQETLNFIEHERRGTFVLSDVKLLHSRTEGWPAALRIIASTSIDTMQDFAQYVRSLTGTQRPIDGYLAEMLDGLPQEMVLFMLQTSILDRLSAPLCDAVTEASSSRELLASIEKRQMLLAPVDQERQWYRYHPLLAEYLNQKLEREHADKIPAMHRRASLWYASQEFWTDAVKHAIAAGDMDRAISWITNCAMTLVKQGDLFTLLAWQRQFPAELMHSQLEAKLAIAWGMALAMRFDESLELLREIELDVGDPEARAAESLRSELQAIRSVAIALKDDTETATPLAQDCLSRSSDPWTANVASNVVRFGHLKAGDLERFYATPWIPYSLEDDRRNVFASVYRRCIQGLAELQQLRLSSADRCYLDALRLAEQHVGLNSVAAALPASLIARIRYEQGLLEEAEAMLVDRESLIGAGALLDCVLSAYLVMTRAAACRKNPDRAYTLLERAENLAAARGWGRLAAAAIAERARLNLDEGRVSEAAGCLVRLERLAAEYPVTARCAWSDIGRYARLTRGYVASKQNRTDEAVSVLAGLRRDAQSVQNHYFALRVGVHLSAVMFKAKRITEALRSFAGILELAAPARIYRTILDEGADVGPVLMAFLENAERTENSRELMPYIRKLVQDWQVGHQSDGKEISVAIAGSLSVREKDTLALIAQGLSNKEIARTLAITPETVKSHVKHIFTKLSVEKRAQAVSRAQSLGLVGTH